MTFMGGIFNLTVKEKIYHRKIEMIGRKCESDGEHLNLKVQNDKLNGKHEHSVYKTKMQRRKIRINGKIDASTMEKTVENKKKL